MKLRKALGIIIILLGIALLGAALLLYLNNRREDENAGVEAANMVADIESLIAASQTADTPSVPSDELPQSPATQEPAAEQPSQEVVLKKGYEYLGILEIPAIERKLPVMADWDYDRLTYAPCRHFGAVETDDLVIAGHNYNKHFGYLGKLTVGCAVYFTDMEGNCTEYSVVSKQKMDPEDVDPVQNSGHDLVLYTCTLGGTSRITIFCDRVE